MLHLHGCLETAAQIYFIFLYRFCSLWYCFSKNKCCLYIWDSYFDRICSHSSCKLQMYKLHLYFYRVVMFYMCLVQRENWIKSIRSWCPQMQTHTHSALKRARRYHTQISWALTPWHEHPPALWLPKPEPRVLIKLALSSWREAAMELRVYMMVLFRSLSEGEVYQVFYLCQVCAFNCFFFFLNKTPDLSLFSIIFMKTWNFTHE